MSMEKIKKFVKDHKTEIVCYVLLGASSVALGYKWCNWHKLSTAKKWYAENDWFIQQCKDFDVAAKGCTAYTLAKPEAVWAAFDKDGNLVDAVKDIGGDLINPKMLMVFGDQVNK